ncbi:41262_t:CDS:2, partial [Gigaspora margarita]
MDKVSKEKEKEIPKMTKCQSNKAPKSKHLKPTNTNRTGPLPIFVKKSGCFILLLAYAPPWWGVLEHT